MPQLATPRKTVISRRKTISIVAAMACALLYASFPIDIFADRQNYLGYASFRSEPLLERFWSQGWIPFLFNEPLWLYLNIFLANFFEPETIVRLIIFFPAFVVYYFGISRTGAWFLVFILLTIHPIFSSNHLMHLRFALGLAVFCLGFFAAGPRSRWFFILLSPLLHSAFFVFVLMYALVEVSKKIKQFRFSIVFLFVGFALIFSMSFELLVGTARQAERYADLEVEVGGGLFITLMPLMLIFLYQGREFFQQHAFAIFTLGFYLGSYWIFPYPRRFLDAGILFILIAGLNLPLRFRYAFVAIMGFLLLFFLRDRWYLPYFGMARHLGS
ncbi:hypothetical protein HUK65_16355 [Rhodobacteraceae bacterium 2376]|uniref:Uncharacterized protein n=1 Tax=Rhabdonatronobacter sediminivivens TaxID=2743469 RepID=A0A7Z0I249_9RHOB|nr:EpsG family protein [Rhabdonatronobacter sediminivivens]NYS26559.1 hypothetical protein [Rhabdonatronobacter sediminivivens]